MDTEETEAVIQANPSVDRDSIERARAATRQLHDVGISTGASYKIDAPFGRRLDVEPSLATTRRR